MTRKFTRVVSCLFFSVDTRLSSDDFVEIAKLIGHNRSLSTMVVFGSRLSDAAGIAIADALDDAADPGSQSKLTEVRARAWH